MCNVFKTILQFVVYVVIVLLTVYWISVEQLTYILLDIPTLIFDTLVRLIPANGHESTMIDIGLMGIYTFLALILPVLWWLVVFFAPFAIFRNVSNKYINC